MKVAGLALALLAGTSLTALSSPLGAQAAARIATTLSTAELTALETVRKAVWVDWYSGDSAALHRVLGPELVAISPSVAHWQSLQQSLSASADFKAKGGKLVSVTFDSATAHRFGDVVVLFSQYTVRSENGDKRSTQTGRATEVFVRTNGRWVHTSWHLDRDP